jgi:hypothetical protein
MSPWKSVMLLRNLRFDRKTAILFLMVFLFGCSGAKPIPSPILSTPTLRSTLTATPAEVVVGSSSLSIPIIKGTSTQATQSIPANTIPDVPHGTLLPTTLPTPTRGVPPTSTLSPKQECPPPTNAKVKIEFSDNIQDYGPQILEYFTANGSRAGVEDQIGKLGVNERVWNKQTAKDEVVFVPDSIAFTEADLTGDQVKETVVILKQVDRAIGVGDDLGVFVVGCRDGRYQMLSGGNDFFRMGADPVQSGVLDILDINADGIMEIILWDTFYWQSAHADVSHFYNILEWNGNRFRNLFKQVEDSGGQKWVEVMNDRLELQDIDNNGTTEVLLPDWSGFMCGFGPVKITKSIYMWNGVYYQYMWTDPGVPYYQFQAVFAGDYYSTIGLYDKAERSYWRAINDPTLKPFVFSTLEECMGRQPWEPKDPNYVLAYARFRFVELLAFIGNDSESENELNQLKGIFPEQTLGHQYTNLADIFWKAYRPKKDIDGACAAVRDEASRRPDEIFDPLYFGYQDPGPTLETICPFTSQAEG